MCMALEVALDVLFTRINRAIYVIGVFLLLRFVNFCILQCCYILQ